MSHYLTLKKIGQMVAYYPNLTKKLGNVNASILLSQFIYWHDKTENPLGVYKTMEEIQAETGLSRREQESGRKVLRELGLITETHKRLDHKLFFLFHPDVFDSWFDSDIPECTKPTFGEVQNRHSGSSKNDIRYIHKITTENTTEEVEQSAAASPVIQDEQTSYQDGQPLALDIEKIKTKFAMAGIIPSNKTVLANIEAIGYELYEFNLKYQHLYMSESEAYLKLVRWFKNIKNNGQLDNFFKVQEEVSAPVTSSFRAPLPIRGVAK